jgi:hypothetical protein
MALADYRLAVLPKRVVRKASVSGLAYIKWDTGVRHDLIFLSHPACRPAARCVRRRVESIYSRRSEEPKASCQRKPTAPLALSSTERLHKKPFACLPTALRPSGPVQQRIFHQAQKTIDNSPGPAIWLGHRKGRLKTLYIRIAPTTFDQWLAAGAR